MMDCQLGAAAMLRHRPVTGLCAASSEAASELVSRIVSVDDKRATWFENPPDVIQELTTIGQSANHSQRAEQASRIVERGGSERFQFDEIDFVKFDLKLCSFRFISNDFEHRFRKVDANTLKAELGEVDQ